MASTVGGLFDEYTTLSLAEKATGVAAFGNVLFDHFIFDSGQGGTGGNDVYIITKPGVDVAGSPGIDAIISSVSVTLKGGIEIGILTGGDDLSLKGGSGENLLVGNEGNNLIDGSSGTDTALGGGGNDTIIGGTAGDSLNGGMGNDCIDGASGNDCIDGGLGNDCIMGGSGSDTIAGGEGDDTIEGGMGADCIHGGMGNDCIGGGSGNDTINAGAGNDTVSGGTGNDWFVFTIGEGITHITDFAIGKDTLHIAHDINGENLQTAQEILSQHVSENPQGDAVITFGNRIIVLDGIHAHDLNPGVFVIE